MGNNVDILAALEPLRSALEAARRVRQGGPVKAEHSRKPTRARRSCPRCGGGAVAASVVIPLVAGRRLVPGGRLVCDTCLSYIAIHMDGPMRERAALRALLDLPPSEKGRTSPVRALPQGRFGPRHPAAWFACKHAL